MELPKPPFKLTSLACFFLLLFTTTIQSFVTRTLGGLPPPPPHRRHHHHHKTMTFYMPNMLNSNLPYPPTTQPTTKVNSQPIPFSKPLGLFPPVGGIPVYDSNSIPSQTSTLSGFGSGISFLASAVLEEELEFGMVNVIDVDLLESTKLYGLTSFGKAKGIYVASSEDENGHMMAMTTSFVENEFKDELRFFGVHQASESHISVIGGTGKYEGANGYAIIKAAKLSSKSVKDIEETNNFLLVDVYLG